MSSVRSRDDVRHALARDRNTVPSSFGCTCVFAGIDIMIDVQRIRELLKKVPRPPGEPIPYGLTDTDCEQFEERTGIPLPEDLRTWLKITNGPCVGPGGLYGIRPQRQELDIEGILNLVPSWATHKWIPIGADGCGNFYIIPTNAEFGSGFPVLFI